MLACRLARKPRASAHSLVGLVPAWFSQRGENGTVKNNLNKRNALGELEISNTSHANSRDRLAGSLSLLSRCLCSASSYFLFRRFSLAPVIAPSARHYYSRPLFATIATSFFFRDFSPTSCLHHSVEGRTYCLFSSGAYV